MKQLINQNVNYANHTNSSAPKWANTSAAMDSFSTIICNRKIVIIDVSNTEKIPKKEKPANKALHTDGNSATLHCRR